MENRPALAIAIISLGFGGCSRSYLFEELRSGYQEAELPAVFANGNARFRLSGHAAYSGQEEIAYTRPYSFATGSDGEEKQVNQGRGEYRIRRDPAAFGGSLILLGDGPFAGLSGGFAAPNPEHWNMGFVGGWTKNMGSVTPMISAGIFYNHISVRARHYSTTTFLLGPENTRLDTTSMYLEDVTWPLKLGLMFHVGPVDPFVVIGRDATRFWPFSQHDDDGDYTVYSRELTLGCRIPTGAGLSVSLEAGREEAEISTLWDGSHWTGRVKVELDRF